VTQPDLFTAAAVQTSNPAPRAFIETQFPVSKLSKECYKERKSTSSQTLTGLGKWWGRKPLILVRATILGLLLPATDDPRKDREVFLRILTMDPDGLQLRRKKIPMKVVWERLTPSERRKFFVDGDAEEPPARIQWKPGKQKQHGDEVQALAFSRMTYDEKLDYARRPEEIAGPSEESWAIINAHLGTKATNIAELVRELGIRRFGHVPRVGDAFCGGGSIPFEAARIGCDAYGSDLNPVAALLTWAALNIVGGGPEVAERVRKAQREVYNAVDRQVTAWGIEHKTEDVSEDVWRDIVHRVESGELAPADVSCMVPRADAYLYCVEVRCPQTGWMVPLAPSWVIGEKTKTVAILVPDHANKRYDIEIKMDASPAEMKAAKVGTVRDGRIIHPILIEQGMEANAATVTSLREAAGGLRLWENDDVVPRPGDVFQERLYCIRWTRKYRDTNAQGQEVEREERWYASVTDADRKREELVLALLKERFADWQAKGYIPSRTIEPGYNTDQPIRERGWTHWHHLFNPRQLVVLGSFSERITAYEGTIEEKVTLTLRLGRCGDYCSKLSQWDSDKTTELVNHVFANQALNTLLTYGARTWKALEDSIILDFPVISSNLTHGQVYPLDARQLNQAQDIWITDPPYADAINYHELTCFFLAWYEANIQRHFGGWPVEVRGALAIKGTDDDFRRSMVASYKKMADQMSDEGFQVVLFTHQDASVWADLTNILWAAGLHVSAAWCVLTETDKPKPTGNYVQGTVLLVLRKQTGNESAFLDELYPEVETEVRAQLDAMLALDDKEDPNFADTDYQLAAYAAALRVLTKYRRFEGRDVAQELNRVRPKGEKSPVEKLIEDAVRVAADHLVPRGIETFVWKTLRPPERFYLKGLDMESHGELRSGAYQELARGFGLREYRNLFACGQANQTRLKTATEFGRREMTSRREGAAPDFANSLLRHVLFAVAEVTKTGETSKGRLWLRTEWPNYWGDRKTILALLAYLGRLGVTLGHWQEDAASAKVLAGAVENDHA
jgi:adenine-specific DNA methylase